MLLNPFSFNIAQVCHLLFMISLFLNIHSESSNPLPTAARNRLNVRMRKAAHAQQNWLQTNSKLVNKKNCSVNFLICDLNKMVDFHLIILCKYTIILNITDIFLCFSLNYIFITIVFSLFVCFLFYGKFLLLKTLPTLKILLPFIIK